MKIDGILLDSVVLIPPMPAPVVAHPAMLYGMICGFEGSFCTRCLYVPAFAIHTEVRTLDIQPYDST